MKLHESISIERIIELVEADDNQGLCLACGDEAYGVEPDARKYKCESCGELKVYGAEELLIMAGG
jgi:Zn finger protein HypA/HybF involved in hydrogenase expression